MRSLRRFLARLMNLATRRTHDERLREEIEEHIALQTAENLSAGLSPVEPRRQALLKFGGVEAIKEGYRREGGLQFIENSLRDVRFALRMLRKSPGFTAVAIVTLALGIGANAVVFSVLNALILHPLHLPQSESLYGIQHGNEASSYQSYPDYLDLRDRNRTFDELAAYDAAQVGLDTGEKPRCHPRSGDRFANCHLRRAGHFFDGCRSRTAALIAQQFRFSAPQRPVGRHRSEYERLPRR